MRYETINVTPVTPRIGAEVDGLTLAKPLSNRQVEELHQALAEHQVLFFRDQPLDVESCTRTGRETRASSGSYPPASGRTPSCHRTNRLGSRRAMLPSQCIDARSRAFEPLVFPSRPACESLVDMTEHLNVLRAVEPPVVIHPAPHHRVHEASQVLQLLVVSGGRHPPLANSFPDRLGGLGADRRQETHKVPSPPVLRASRLERISQEVELDLIVLPRPVVILAVDDLGLR